MWKDLSIKEKAALINIGVKNGLYDLEDIKSSYNKYAEGGPLDDAEIVLPAVNLGEVKIPIVEGTDEIDTPIVMPKPKDTYSPVPLTKKTQMEVFGLNKPYNSLHRDEAQRVGDFYRDDNNAIPSIWGGDYPGFIYRPFTALDTEFQQRINVIQRTVSSHYPRPVVKEKPFLNSDFLKTVSNG